jgi:hypothetical protein
LAFGTFIGLQDPLTFFGDADFIRTRFMANPSGSFAAEVNCELVGSNFVANWGSIGILGFSHTKNDLEKILLYNFLQ